MNSVASKITSIQQHCRQCKILKVTLENPMRSLNLFMIVFFPFYYSSIHAQWWSIKPSVPRRVLDSIWSSYFKINACTIFFFSLSLPRFITSVNPKTAQEAHTTGPKYHQQKTLTPKKPIPRTMNLTSTQRKISWGIFN